MDGGGSGDSSSSSSSEDERDLDEDKLPTVEDMDRLEDRLEAAQSEQKNLFLIVFQRQVWQGGRSVEGMWLFAIYISLW